jgi:hypothetical protein
MALKDEDLQKIKARWTKETRKQYQKTGQQTAIGKYYRHGWIDDMVWAAGFMVSYGRNDISKAVMDEAYLDFEKCREIRYPILMYS